MSAQEESEGRKPQISGSKNHKKVRITHSFVLCAPQTYLHIRFIYKAPFKIVLPTKD